MGLSGKAGIGGVLRNSLGGIVCSFSTPVEVLEVSTVELLAIHKACALCASRSDFIGENISIRSDSRSAVSWVNDKDFGNLRSWELIVDIRSLLLSLGNTVVVFCPRESNEAADSLAKLGSDLDEEVIEWPCSGGL
ncbi:hypothetical protein Q3G72_006656 [Acer saccharum]|nr:hypothetical protein Q3G72_006656 [Acer saccharum]